MFPLLILAKYWISYFHDLLLQEEIQEGLETIAVIYVLKVAMVP